MILGILAKVVFDMGSLPCGAYLCWRAGAKGVVVCLSASQAGLETLVKVRVVVVMVVRVMCGNMLSGEVLIALFLAVSERGQRDVGQIRSHNGSEERC